MKSFYLEVTSFSQVGSHQIKVNKIYIQSLRKNDHITKMLPHICNTRQKPILNLTEPFLLVKMANLQNPPFLLDKMTEQLSKKFLFPQVMI